MPNNLEVKPSAISARISRGNQPPHTETLAITIKEGCTLVSYKGQVVQSEYKNWVRLTPDWVSFNNNRRSDEVKLSLRVPKNVESKEHPKKVEIKEHKFTLRFTNEEQPSDFTDVAIALDVQDPWKFWLRENILLVIFIVLLAIIVAVLLGRCGAPGTNTPAQAPATIAITPTLTDPASSSTPTAEPLASEVRQIKQIPFHWVSAGEFPMGGDNKKCDLPSFWITGTEVSNAQYDTCVVNWPRSKPLTPSDVNIDPAEPVRWVG